MLTGNRKVELLWMDGRAFLRKISGPVTSLTVVVPEGYVSDGASIPRLFWRFIGHPFDPLFLRPALVHDIRCEFRVGRWQDTHEEFLHHLQWEGVSPTRAKLMHRAVWYGGPRWPEWKSLSLDDLAAITASSTYKGRPWGAYEP